MNIDAARKILLLSGRDTPGEKEAIDTLYALAVERDEMARQADFWYNESLKTERTKDLIVRK